MLFWRHAPSADSDILFVRAWLIGFRKRNNLAMKSDAPLCIVFYKDDTKELVNDYAFTNLLISHGGSVLNQVLVLQAYVEYKKSGVGIYDRTYTKTLLDWRSTTSFDLPFDAMKRLVALQIENMCKQHSQAAMHSSDAAIWGRWIAKMKANCCMDSNSKLWFSHLVEVTLYNNDRFESEDPEHQEKQLEDRSAIDDAARYQKVC